MPMNPYPPDRFGQHFISPCGQVISAAEAQRIAQLQADTEAIRAHGHAPKPRLEVRRRGLDQLKALKESLK